MRLGYPCGSEDRDLLHAYIDKLTTVQVRTILLLCFRLSCPLLNISLHTNDAAKRRLGTEYQYFR